MLRQLFHWIGRCLAAGSFLLLAATIVLWAHSYWRAYYRFEVTAANWTHFTSSHGKLEVYWKTSNIRNFGAQSTYSAVRKPYRLNLDPPVDAAAGWTIGDCGWTLYRKDRDMVREFVVPYAAIAGLFAMLPAVQVWGWVKRRRAKRPPKPGTCAHCGYDLRATPERCPECGMPREFFR